MNRNYSITQKSDRRDYAIMILSHSEVVRPRGRCAAETLRRFALKIREYAYSLCPARACKVWGIPAAAYVTSLCLREDTPVHQENSKGWHIRSSGCLNPQFRGSLPGKESRPSVSEGKAPDLKPEQCGGKCIGVYEKVFSGGKNWKNLVPEKLWK